MTRKWSIINDNSNANYGVGNETNYNTEVLKSIFCDYNDAYITFIAPPQTQEAFKNCVPFSKCITKIDGTRIDDAENIDLVMQFSLVVSNLCLETKSSPFESGC